jgi:hypothetical protein
VAYQNLGAKQWTLPRNMMRFFFADGFLPVARTHVQLVALGKKSSTARRPAVAGAALDWDVEMTDASFRTGYGGEIALDDPLLIPAYDALAEEIKRHHPYMTHWDGVPGQFTPEFSGIVNPQLASDSTYPKVPLTVELVDQSMSPGVVSFPMNPGPVVTSWKRPPLATFDQNDFYNVQEFLDYLADRYSFLSNLRVPDLPINLIRSGPPFVELAFHNLQLQFASGNLRNRNGVLQEDEIMKRVSEILSRDLRIPKTKAPADIYLTALRSLAALQPVNPLVGPPESLARSILDVLGTGPAIVSFPTAAEDWAALGTLVFYIGAIAFGYRWGAFTRTFTSNWWEIDAISRIKP